MIALKKLILAGIIGYILYIPTSYAIPCTADVTPSDSCENLVVRSSSVSINVPLLVTISAISSSAALSLPDYSATGITIINSGKLISPDSFGLSNRSLLTTIFNSGYIAGDSWGLSSTGLSPSNGVLYSPHPDTNIASLVNTGLISSTQYAGIYSDWGNLGTLTNTGTIIGNNSWGGITVMPQATLTTLNNLQGDGTKYIPIDGGALIASGPLKYTGYQQSNLPANYNIIIYSGTNYGQLAVLSGGGAMAFGVYGGAVGFTPIAYTNSIGGASTIGASIVTAHTYSNVLQGLVGAITNSGSGYSIVGSNFSVTGITGTYAGYNYSLVSDGDASLGNWDLVFALNGPSVTDTQSSIHNSAQRLRSTFNASAISTNFANMNIYDCNLFDTKGMCISAGGRYTTVDNPNSNSTSAVVVVGYKATPNIRIGGFLDQNVSNNTPTGIKISNKNPLMGVFAVWNQNANGLGYQVKVANAYQDKDVNTTRDVIGTSEAGTGATNLNTQSYVGELSYAFLTNQNKTTLRPYLALRQTTIKQDAYTETGVANPLSYGSLKDRSTTALVGLKLNHAVTPKATLTASLGIEQDLKHSVDQYSATSTSISGLTSENFNDSIKRTRPVASIGTYYAVSKTQRISGDVYYQQLPFQSTGSTTAYFSYMIGL